MKPSFAKASEDRPSFAKASEGKPSHARASDNKRPLRLFVAIEVTEKIRALLERIQATLKNEIEEAKWVKPENIHLTLKFLGHVSSVKVEDVKKAIVAALEGTAPFTIRTSVAGVFPSARKPRVLWLGIGEGEKNCVDTARALEERLEPLGIERETRKFHPHLTLGRIKFLKDRSSVEKAYAGLVLNEVSMDVGEISLFQSELSAEGPIYTKLLSCELKSAT